MQFAGKLNETEIREASRMIRPKGYARRMALSYLRLGVYVVIILFIVIRSVVEHQHLPPQYLAIRFLLLALFGTIAFVRIRKSTRDRVAKLDASLPDSLILDTAGVRLDGPFGAQSFQPWASYKAFREGAHVIVLERTEPDLFNVLPISALRPTERETLLGMLQVSLPVTTLVR